MKTKLISLTILTFVFILSIMQGTNSLAISESAAVTHALIIQGDIWSEFSAPAHFVKWCLINVLGVPSENIRHLAPPGSPFSPDDPATHENVRQYVGDWLANQQGNLFIYITAHGGGFNVTTGQLAGGRWDDDGDEGLEHCGMGVDECILLAADNSKYWDDEFREDLQNAANKWLTVVLASCGKEDTSSNGTCFGGGFIDDLSSIYYRTIVSSANETGLSWTGRETAPVDPFTYYFFNAFSEYKIIYDPFNIHFDPNQPINWEYKSWRGAFEYALLHDPYYSEGMEHPWFDDDGDGLPTYVGDAEIPDFPWNDQELMRWLKCDINNDFKVDMKDIGMVIAAFGSIPGSSNWNRQADVTEDWTVDMTDVGKVVRHFGEAT
jgi:hypothetical protein